MAAAFALLDLGLAIWDLVDGVKALKQGSVTAETFKTAANDLEEVHNRNEKYFQDIVSQCVISQGKRCHESTWSVQLWFYIVSFITVITYRSKLSPRRLFVLGVPNKGFYLEQATIRE